MDELRNSVCPAVIGHGKIDRRNSEGYQDTTVYEAFCNIRREEKAKRKQNFKPLVYICSAFAGDVVENSEKARSYCRFALSQNALPLAMHLLLPQFMDDNDPEQRRRAMFMNSIVQGKCDELWVFSDGVLSAGMQEEIATAEKRRQTIRWFNRNCEEVSKDAVR